MALLNTIIKNFLFLSTTLVVLLHGFADKRIYGLAIFLLLALNFWEQLKTKFSLYLTVILALIGIVFPNYTILYGYIALVLFNSRFRHLSLVPLLMCVAEYLGVSLTNYLSIILFYVISLPILYYLSKKPIIEKYILLSFSMICIIITSITLPYFKDKTFVEPYNESIYSPSSLFCDVADVSYWKKTNKDDFVLRSNSFFPKISETQPGIICSDIDYNGQSLFLDNKKWQQPVCWNNNLFFGNQYFIESLYKDGALFSNIGITLKDTCDILLSCPRSLTHSQPLIIKNKNTYFLHDSDYMTSFLANYQTCFIRELVNTGFRPNLIRLTNILFFITILLSVFNKRISLVISPLVICLVMTGCYDLRKVEGDVRMVGQIVNSHENFKFDGVPKKIVESGFNYTVGDTNCKILVVKSGETAEWKNETLIIGEPNSKIKFKGQTLYVDENPMGTINSVVDARNWIIDNQPKGCIMKFQNITFIATGSPALILWKDYIK